MSGEIEIARYRPEHRRTVAELQTSLWGGDVARNERYLVWKYAENPWATEPRIFLALRDGQAVGMRGFYESRWEAGDGGRAIAVPLADDLAIAAGERNRGLVTRIMQAALRDLAAAGFEYMFSLSAGPITTLSSLALGWRSAGRYDPIALRSRGVACRARIREWMYRIPLLWRLPLSSRVFSRAEREPLRRIDACWPRGQALELADKPRSKAMARLVGELGHDGRIRHVRSAEYFAWRFANPMYEYRFLYAGGREDLDGYLVLRARSFTARVAISDLEGKNERVRAELLRAAARYGFPELYAWSSTLSAPEREVLRERGLTPTEPQLTARGCPCALVRCTADRPTSEWSLGSRPLLDPASWDLRMLYSMAG